MLYLSLLPSVAEQEIRYLVFKSSPAIHLVLPLNFREVTAEKVGTVSPPMHVSSLNGRGEGEIGPPPRGRSDNDKPRPLCSEEF
jgi:hypothetical protein